MAFNFVANAAAIASLASSAFEAGEMGAREARQSSKRAVAIKDIRYFTGDRVLNKSSEKHNAMKAIVRDSDFLTTFHKIGGGVTGFFKGVFDGMKDNLITAGFSIITLLSKNKTVKTIGVAGLGISTAWDFLKNGTNLFTDKSLIEK